MCLFTISATKSDSMNLPRQCENKTMKNIFTNCARVLFVFASFVRLCFHKILFSVIHCHHNYRLAKVEFSICVCGGGANAYDNHNGDIISGVTGFCVFIILSLSSFMLFSLFSVLFFVQPAIVWH